MVECFVFLRPLGLRLKRLLDGFGSLKAKYPGIGDVRGLGLMLAMEFVLPGERKRPDPKTTMRVLEESLKRGLLGYMAGNQGQVLRLIPPLIVTEAQVDEALNILDKSLAVASA